MKSLDRLSSLFFICLSLAICLVSLRFRAGTLEAPGSMAFPMLIGLCLLGTSIALFVKSGSSPRANFAEIFPKEESRGVLYFMAILFFCTFIFESVGFLISVFLLLWVLLKMIGGKTLGR